MVRKAPFQAGPLLSWKTSQSFPWICKEGWKENFRALVSAISRGQGREEESLLAFFLHRALLLGPCLTTWTCTFSGRGRPPQLAPRLREEDFAELCGFWVAKQDPRLEAPSLWAGPCAWGSCHCFIQ